MEALIANNPVLKNLTDKGKLLAFADELLILAYSGEEAMEALKSISELK